jgi:hypothetical protein
MTSKSWIAVTNKSNANSQETHLDGGEMYRVGHTTHTRLASREIEDALSNTPLLNAFNHGIIISCIVHHKCNNLLLVSDRMIC